ncbi:TPA: O-antigen ligase family protein [Klebsiella pneumoniae]|nr:O-antigen ligase family protein [Klebsiella pneumoniae]HCG2949723.1 O-antigen ligase family protein [Klebsiella pneumoniae]
MLNRILSNPYPSKFVAILISVLVAISAQGSSDINIFNAICYVGFVLLTFLIIVAVIIQNKSVVPYELIKCSVLFLFFTFISLMSLYLSDIEYIRFLAVYFNYILFFFGLLFGIVTCYYFDEDFIVKWFFTASVINGIYIFLVFFSSGENMFTARYHIVGSLVPIIFIPIMCKFLLKSYVDESIDLSWYYYFITFLAFVLLIISQTRTYFIGLAGAFVFFSIFINRKMPFGKESLKIILIVFFVILSIENLVGVSDSLDNFFERFMLIGTNDDITSTTRVAEYSYQMNFIFSSAERVIFGSGLGQQFFYDDKYYYALQDVYTIDQYSEKGGTTFGHSLYVYTLFSSGLFVFLYIIYKALFFVFIAIKNRHLIQSSFLDSFLCLALFIFMVFGFFMSPMGARESAYVFGVIVGCLYARSRNWFFR